MTPEERAHAWVEEAYLCEHGERNEFRHNYECETCVASLLVGAALRERDAAHEIALKKARADAMDAAAALFDKKDAEARAETYFVTQPYGGVREEHPSGYYLSAREAARAIRALLEEADK